MPSDFDIAAKTYDADFTFSRIGKAQRCRVHQFLDKNILVKAQNLSILELNCGTGEDALFFSKKGHQVLATDVSAGMIAEAKDKSKGKNVQYEVLDINDISEERFNEKFDLIFSNFGGFNCLSPSQLESFLKRAPKLLTDNGKMVFVIMPRHCLWERFYFFLKGDRQRVKRRKSKNPIVANVEGVEVLTWYYNPREVVTLSGEHFNPVSVKPIGICIPPSYLESFFRRKNLLLALFIGLEKLFYTSFWAKYADHYIISLEKK